MPRWTNLTAMMLCLTACSSADMAVDPDGPPNIVFILVDDMGYGDAGANNPDSKIPTPGLDQLASEGMRFTDAHSAGSVCKPSRYGLMTGRNPIHMARPYETGLIEPDTPTLASLLKAADYETVAIGKWHLGIIDEKNPQPDLDLQGGPLDFGFDYFFGMPASLDIAPYYYIENRQAVTRPTQTVPRSHGYGPRGIQGPFFRGGKIAPGFDHDAVVDELTRKASEELVRLSKNPDQPFFLYLAYPAPHTPWLASDDSDGVSNAGEYGDYIVDVDKAVAEVLRNIDAADLRDDTLVIFSSDNGPVWFPQNVQTYGHDATAGFAGMKGDVTEGGHHVPFIARWPGVIVPGTTQDGLVMLSDTFATFADIVELETPTDPRLDSESYLPLLRNEDGLRHSSLHTNEGWHDPNAIRVGDWKLIDVKGYGGFTDRTDPTVAESNPYPGRLYNLADDPYETDNLYQRYPQKVEELQAALQSRLDAAKAMQ